MAESLTESEPEFEYKVLSTSYTLLQVELGTSESG